MIRMLVIMGLLFSLFSSVCGKKIKYDGRTIKILLVTTIVSALLFLAGVVCSFIMADAGRVGVIVVLGFFVGGGLFLYAGIHLLIGFCYIRRLKAYGYEIPYKKEDYGDDLRNVPRVSGKSCPGIKNVGRRVLVFFYATVFVLANVWNVWYIIRWYQFDGALAVFFLFIMLLFDSLWGISAFMFYRQGNRQRYRDDVEIDDSRKERVPVENGFVSGIILLYIMMICKMLVVQFGEYAFRSRAEHDQLHLQTISRCIDAAMMADGTDRTSDSYMQMREGCYISDWGSPDDAFSREVAEYLGISDYSELNEKFSTSDGSPKIYVKISDEGVYVRMDNPLRLDRGIQFSYEEEYLR